MASLKKYLLLFLSLLVLYIVPAIGKGKKITKALIYEVDRNDTSQQWLFATSYYSPDGRLLSTKIYCGAKYDTTCLTSIMKNTYDRKKNLIDSLLLYRNGDTIHTTFAYDKKGKLYKKETHKSTVKNSSRGIDVYSFETEYFFYKKKRLTHSIIINKWRGRYNRIYKKIYHYDDEDRRHIDSSFNTECTFDPELAPDTCSWTYDSRTVRTYIADGYTSKTYIGDDNTRSTSPATHTFKKDEKGRVIESNTKTGRWLFTDYYGYFPDKRKIKSVFVQDYHNNLFYKTETVHVYVYE